MNNTLTAETIAHFACDYAYAREIGNRHTLDYIDNEIGKCDEETYKQFRMCVASIAAFQTKQQFTRKQLGA